MSELAIVLHDESVRSAPEREFFCALKDICFIIDACGTILDVNRTAEAHFHALGIEPLGSNLGTHLRLPDDVTWCGITSLNGPGTGCNPVHAAVSGLGSAILDSYIVPFKRDGADQWLVLVNPRQSMVAERRRTVSERLRDLEVVAENVSDVTVRLDAGLCFTFANTQIQKFTGFRPQELIGKPLWNVGLPLDLVVYWEKLVVETMRSGKITARVFVIMENGRERHYESRVIPDSFSDITNVLIVTRDVTQRHQQESELKRYADKMETLSRSLMEVQERERGHLARELHDEVGQNLTAIKFDLEALCKGIDETRTGQLQNCVKTVDVLLSQIRNISLDLRPSMLDDLGLEDTLIWFVERQSELASIKTNIRIELGRRLPLMIETACFRIVQEAFTNMLRHAAAKRVTVSVCCEGYALRVLITDDGKGFDVKAALSRSSKGRSFGLVSMQERVLLLGGRIKIESEMGKGTTIEALFPVAESVEPKVNT